MSTNHNLFVALREGFPAELDGIAIETADGPGAPLLYTWRDVERATAMIANLLDSLGLPAGARVAVQGAAFLNDGDVVRVVEDSKPKQPSAPASQAQTATK